jgi:aspartate-semialdehyde dehydrogenase
MQKGIPLIVPDIDPDLTVNHKTIIVSPNCSTIITLMALFALHPKFGLTGFCASAYQAVSGIGFRMIEALQRDKTGHFSCSRDIFRAHLSN